MLGIKKFWLKLNDNMIGRIILCVISIAILFAIYIPAKNAVEDLRISETSVLEDNNIMVEIESLTEEKDKIKISGWGLRIDSKNENFKLILRPTEDGKVRILDTDNYEYTEPGEYYVPGWDFGECGFSASVNKKKLDDNICYEILILLDYVEAEHIADEQPDIVTKVISTNQYIYQGELCRYNPKEFNVPEVNDADVRRAIDEGVLLSFDSENKVWFYELEHKIYYIINFELFGTLEEMPEVPSSVYTSQPDKLPVSSQERGNFRIAHYLNETNYSEEEQQPYYIGCFALPTEYPITYVKSGAYRNRGDKSGWQKEYEFKLDMFAGISGK